MNPNRHPGKARTLLAGLAGGVMALALEAAPALAIDPFFPEFGNPGIDVMHYHLDLDVNPASGRVGGGAAIVIKAERRLASFSLDLHAFDVTRVKINGKAARFARKGDKLVITPQRPIPASQVFWLDVAYAGKPDPLPDPTAPNDKLYLGWFKYKTASYVVSEPVGASSFFPANDEPTDKATFSYSIAVPPEYTAAANGVFLGASADGAKKRFRWAMLQPMTTWLATVHVNRFRARLTQAPDGTPIRVYAPAGVPQSHIAAYAEAGRMLTYFERLVGPYPFASYGSVVVQDPALYYALETQAMSTFPDGGDIPDEGLIAHELAHQWFGNSISVAKWEDLWIAEGTATYFEVLWPNRDDPKGFDADMQAIYDYVAAEKIGPAVVDKPEELFSDRTYYRGAAALYALRLKVGDARFFRILRRFAQANAGGNVTSADFIRTAVNQSGDPSVRPLLEAWLYDEAVPPLPGRTERALRKGSVPKPDIVGGRCGRGSHRGAKAEC